MLISRTCRIALPTLLGTLATAAWTAPAVLANAQRYAAPNGSGTACTTASPCDIRKAVEGASAGDEVIVEPGDYPLTDPLTTPAQIVVHGVAGQPRPRLLFNGTGGPGAVVLGSTLRHVAVEQTAGRALWADTATVEQVVVKSTAPGYDAATIQHNSMIRNSVVVASGTNARAVATGANGLLNMSTYRNVTALATGVNGVAVEARAFGATGSVTVHAINVIARGGPGGTGVIARTDSSGAHAAVALIHSNYGGASTFESNAAITNGGGNQTAPPAFVDPAAGDYRQAPGSPTVGAGVDDPANGTVDLDGDARSVGTTDIGADEFVPAPSAATGAAGAITGSSATLAGTVDAKGVATTYRFEYGTTTAYGHATPSATAGSGPATATVEGLTPGTTYHYRIVATNAGGIAQGNDATFTTTAAPVAPAPAAPTTAAPVVATPVPLAQPFAGVELVSRRLAYKRRAIVVKLRCPAGTIGRCSGRTKLTARRIKLGRAAFSIAPGGRATVKVRATRAGRRLLAGAPRLRAKATIRARNGAGASKITTAAVTIRRHR
jgi:hypothetical protein